MISSTIPIPISVKTEILAIRCPAIIPSLIMERFSATLRDRTSFRLGSEASPSRDSANLIEWYLLRPILYKDSKDALLGQSVSVRVPAAEANNLE